MQCSNLNPCSQGTCNNGYCCAPSLASVSSSILASPSNLGTFNLAGVPSVQLFGSAIPFSQPQSPSCTPGCPRGYSGCCGTQEPSCCLHQLCPGGLPSTGRPCYNSCPTGQICVAGVCCLQVGGDSAIGSTTCPSGGLPFGRCINGLCTSGYACNPSSSMCCPQIAQFAQIPQNALASVCPSGGVAAGSCIGGLCGTGFSCIAPSNLCCPLGTGLVRPASNPFVCPDGTQAAGACINGLCGTGFSCTGGLCCNATSQNPRCLDGSQAVGACINGMCGAGFICTTGNVCCPSTSVVTSTACPNGAASVGVCINNLCPAGFTCINNQCCPSSTTTTPSTMTCTNPAAASGPCLAGNTCSDGGFACDTALNLCCPRVAAIGPCVGGVCPNGFTCFPAGAAANSQCYQTCIGTGAAVGPPLNGNLCPAGTILIFGECCQTARHRAPAHTSFLSENFLDSLQDSVGTCVDGSPVISGCINGACGDGFECLDNFCCSRTTNNGLSFSSHSTRPLDVACETSKECVGFAEGLSTCEMGVCRCKPVAEMQGNACVRRASHILQFSDAIPVEEEKTTKATTSIKKQEQNS
uniref:CC domain-containing protein n=1 Tax=Parascaris univalens TaxID=6257 RepID=A0A915CE46_PARUN